MSEPLDQIREIRSMMERSSKFLSLSGLSGISAGICALLGAWHVYHNTSDDSLVYNRPEMVRILILNGTVVLLSALLSGSYFTIRKARRKGFVIWGPASRSLLTSLVVPLVTGGIFCLGLIYYGHYWICFSATLIFYGLALVSGSKYTVHDTYYLGLAEIALGLAAFFLPGYNLLFWAIGFGVLHIVYGSVMYIRYD